MCRDEGQMELHFSSPPPPPASSPSEYGNSTSTTPRPSSDGALVSRGYSGRRAAGVLFRSPHVAGLGARIPRGGRLG